MVKRRGGATRARARIMGKRSATEQVPLDVAPPRPMCRRRARAGPRASRCPRHGLPQRDVTLGHQCARRLRALNAVSGRCSCRRSTRYPHQNVDEAAREDPRGARIVDRLAASLGQCFAEPVARTTRLSAWGPWGAEVGALAFGPAQHPAHGDAAGVSPRDPVVAAQHVVGVVPAAEEAHGDAGPGRGVGLPAAERGVELLSGVLVGPRRGERRRRCARRTAAGSRCW